MPRLPLAPLLLISAIALAPAHAASFDCKKASTPREKAICANPELSAQDDAVAAAYTALRAHLSPTSADLIRADQREWLRYLDSACPAAKDEPVAVCLLAAYRSRVPQLRLLPRPPGTPVLYTRSHFLLAAASAEDKGATGRDFGTGEFDWPQIDNPNPQQSAWNQAVFAAAVATTGGGPNTKPPANFDASVESAGTIDVSATIVAFNDHLIQVDISNSTYGYGAAHPNTSKTYFSWLPGPGRPLVASDIFRAESHWQDALVPVVIARLRATGTQENGLCDKVCLRKAVAAELANPAAWTLTRAAFTVNFGLYEIEAYAFGMPEASLTWTSLKPYLAVDFHPESLPAPFPTPR